MSTPNDKPTMALDFYNAIVEGYEKYDALRQNPIWQDLYRKRVGIGQRFESKPYGDRNPAAIVEAIESGLADLQVATYEKVPPHIDGYVIAKGDSREIFKMHIYINAAFDIARELDTDDQIATQEIIAEANARTQRKIAEVFEI